MSSSEQLNRIVGLVAELTRRSREGGEAPALDEVAARFSATRAQIQGDIRALTLLGDDPDADWMLSLSVWQEGDRINIASGGPFQRPIRFTGDELVAMQIGLAQADDEQPNLSHSLARILQAAEPVTNGLSGRGRVSPSVRNLVLRAITDRRKLEIRYSGERSLDGVNRVIHPYQLLEQEGHGYVVAWCELADGWRHFRVDRILDAVAAEDYYAPRSDFTPADDSFAPPAETTAVKVRFSPAIARWLKERHPEGESAPEGGIVVTYQVVNPEWLIRYVLQYGPEAEVLAPQSFRDLMKVQIPS
jgi:predicted DNA-binding transcriptional regulator YafY